MKMEYQNGQKCWQAFWSRIWTSALPYKTSFTDGKIGLLPLRLIITHLTDKNLYLSNEAKCGKQQDHLKCVRQEILPSH